VVLKKQMDDHERITHEDLHNEMSRLQLSFNEKHQTMVKWIATSIVAIVGVGMSQLISVAATLSEVDGTQELVLQQLGRVDHKLETIDIRIQQESREAEEDLKDHTREQHKRGEG